MDVYREKRRHTPGPWEYFQGAICYGSPDERSVICTPYLSNGTPEADCILMAAAPELLELAKLCREVIDDDLENRPARYSLGSLHKRLVKLIEKCEGSL